MRWGTAGVLLPTLLWLVACGDKSSTGVDKGSVPIAVASAEPATVEPGGEIILRGRGSSDPAGGELIFHWRQSSDNPFPVSFPTNDTSSAFVLEMSLQELGTYAFILTVENERGQRSLPDTAVVRVNHFPVAEAGQDQVVEVGAEVQLDGSGSQDADGGGLTFRWSAPAGITLRRETESRPQFTANEEGTYQIALVVNDGQVDSGPDIVVISVVPAWEFLFDSLVVTMRQAFVASLISDTTSVAGIKGSVQIAGDTWTFANYSPDGKLTIDGVLVVDEATYPEIPIKGTLRLSGSQVGVLVVNLVNMVNGLEVSTTGTIELNGEVHVIGLDDV